MNTSIFQLMNVRKCLTKCLFLFFLSVSAGHAANGFTLLNADQYHDVVNKARIKVKVLLQEIKPVRKQDLNQQIASITELLTDTPYSNFSIGEGDWLAHARIYQPGGVHINQNPVYRLDVYDCQTFIQMVMALLYSQNLNEFDKRYIEIAYRQIDAKPQIHYINRNHFVEIDFNPNSQRLGLLTDQTNAGILADVVKYAKAKITRNNWLRVQCNYLYKTLQVLNAFNAVHMRQRLAQFSKSLNTNISVNKTLAYIPKQALVHKNPFGQYSANEKNLAAIPTPSIVEVINDSNQWRINGKLIKNIIGSELMVSHMGLLYKKQFKAGDTIYHKIHCTYFNFAKRKFCRVQKVTCQQKSCNELMFVHASNSHPRGYFWFKDQGGNYHCQKNLPKNQISYSNCNRIEHLPFAVYLTDNQTNDYWFAHNPAILGIHIEVLENPIKLNKR